MPDRRIPWWRKVKLALADEGRGAIARLSRATGWHERAIGRWIRRPAGADPSSAPRGELALLKKVAEHFGWPLSYLLDDDLGYPPPAELPGLDEALKRVPPEFLPLIDALGDEATARFLLGALQAWQASRTENGG